MALQPCRLCRKPAELQESHVLPAFVFRWMKKSSATGFFRNGKAPNLRVQDGEKRYWLGRCCEDRLSQWETPFSNQVFYPLIANGGQRIRYGDWMLKFCVSVSWRVLSMFAENSRLDHFNERQLAAITLALDRWSGFLLGTEGNPGIYEQHFLPFDSVESFSGVDMPSNINRYLLRAADIDIVAGGGGAFVYSKFAKFILIGFIDVPNLKEWVGTKIHVRDGHVGQGNFTVPKEFGEFIFDKCRRSAEIKERISEIQQTKIAASMRKDLERTAASETFKALHQDVTLFGKKVFRPIEREDEL